MSFTQEKKYEIKIMRDNNPNESSLLCTSSKKKHFLIHFFHPPHAHYDSLQHFREVDEVVEASH